MVKGTVLRTFSVNVPHYQKSLEILEKWKKQCYNVSEQINRAIIMFDSLQEEEEKREQEPLQEKTTTT